MTRRTLSLLAAALAALLAGCGPGEQTRPDEAALLVLDRAPAAVHSPIFLAVQRDYTGAEGVRLTVRPPRRGGNPAAQLRAGGAQFAIVSIEDLARLRARGRDLVGVMAIAQAPDRRGVPPHPRLLLVVQRRTLQETPALVGATVRALRRGYGEALNDPESAVQALVAAAPSVDPMAAARGLAAVQASFLTDTGAIGVLDLAQLRRWAAWAKRAGVLRQRPEAALMFAPAASTGR